MGWIAGAGATWILLNLVVLAWLEGMSRGRK